MTQTRQKTNYNVRDLMDLVKREMGLEFACHAVGQVVSFNPDTQTIKAKILYGWEQFKRDERTGKYNRFLNQYPPLSDVPVVIMGGGGGALTFPIEAGDECLLLFNDRDIDNWFSGASGGKVASDRLHDLSDGFALIGVYSKLNSLADYDTDRVALSYREAGVVMGKIGVGEKILIKNAAVDFKTQMDLLLTALNVFLTATASASTASQIATAAGAFNPVAVAVKVQLDLLLETEAP